MSQTRWTTHFKAATYGPVVDRDVDPSRTLLDPGQLAPVDLAANEVLHYLRQDAILRAVFKDRGERVPWLSPLDYRTYPRYAVYLSSATNSERPTSTSIEVVSIFVGTMWDAQSAEALGDGQVSVATPLAHVKRVLRAQVARQLVIWYQGSQRALAHDMSIGGERYAAFEGPRNRTAYVHEIQADYRLHVDRGGQLINLA